MAVNRLLRDTRPRRVAVVSLHTSPLDQPGTGDAGGLNVYVLETSRRLAAAGVDVEIFTRAKTSSLAHTVEIEPGVRVSHLRAGPFEELPKEDLPAQMCAFSAGLLRAEAGRPAGWFDLIHSHYWLSGQVGWLASERWDVPLVHSMHTIAKVKNLELANGDRAEPQVRVIGEEQVVENASRLIANTGDEARQLIDLYSASPHAIDVVHPGVDLDVFSPGDRASARATLGLRPEAQVLLFVGRIQPLKAPDVLLRAVARMVESDPARRRGLVVVVCGGPSGSGLDHPSALADLASSLGIADIVRFEPPNDRVRLAQWYRAADATVVPSYSESFGLVAIESQACGTPVVAASVGGLRTAVADGRSGLLVPGHDPDEWARALERMTTRERDHLAAGARGHAEGFSWDATAQALIDSYAHAIGEHAALPVAVGNR
ncbi:MAG: D-inositol-3-phosphate glycosyltransferase [Candidatus Nanopelagicales bacterium]